MVMKMFAILLLFLGGALTSNANPLLKERGDSILTGLLERKWAAELAGASLGETKLIKEKPDLAIPYGLPPVWFAHIKLQDEKIGHLMWDSTGEGRLVEFSLDADLTFDEKSATAIPGVPPLQQFPLKTAEEKLIASGCVPTAAASLVSHWSAKQLPDWTDKNDDLEAITKRLRARLNMRAFPDTDGFTENGMALAGASPKQLALAIQADASARKVAIDCKFAPFSMAAFQEEIAASRPALLSCRVRVPHKPHLSWGHEVAAVGWALVDDIELVGVLDNYFPTKHPGTIRWIRKDAFESMITVKPAEPR